MYLGSSVQRRLWGGACGDDIAKVGSMIRRRDEQAEIQKVELMDVDNGTSEAS